MKRTGNTGVVFAVGTPTLKSARLKGVNLVRAEEQEITGSLVGDCDYGGDVELSSQSFQCEGVMSSVPCERADLCLYSGRLVSQSW